MALTFAEASTLQYVIQVHSLDLDFTLYYKKNNISKKIQDIVQIVLYNSSKDDSKCLSYEQWLWPMGSTNRTFLLQKRGQEMWYLSTWDIHHSRSPSPPSTKANSRLAFDLLSIPIHMPTPVPLNPELNVNVLSASGPRHCV